MEDMYGGDVLLISMIVAVGKNNTIGKGNDILWCLPKHLKYLKETIKEYPIIVGRKTFENFHEFLPSNSVCFVLSKNLDYCVSSKKSSVVFSILKDLLDFTKNGDDFYVIGGGEIFKQFLPYTDRIYMTEVDIDVKADIYFPELSNWEWLIMKQEEGILDEHNTIPHRFVTLERKFKVSK